MLESLSHRVIERHSDPNIEAATYEGQSEFFARAGSDLNAKAAIDAVSVKAGNKAPPVERTSAYANGVR